MTSDLFATAVKKSIEQDLSLADLLAAVEALGRAGEPRLVVELYRIWVEHNRAHPLLYAVNFNFGVVLSEAGDLDGAERAFVAALAQNSGFMPAHINLGNVLERKGATDRAIAQWSSAADALSSVTGEAIQHRITAMKQIGRVLESAKLEANAEAILRRSLDVDPRQRDVIQHWIALRQSQCKWRVLEGSGMAEGELMRAISPLSLAVLCDDPILQLAGAYHYNMCDVRPHSQPRQRLEGARDMRPDRRLRIGYLSSDLREHAVGFLMSEVFELHDPGAVEVFAYYCGIATTDSTKARFKASAHHWRDIASMSDAEAASLMAEDRLDILVDLNGYTKDARLKLVAMRPAPIIVNWLGFPGSMGSPYHNYIIADPFTIPPTHEALYSEKVERLACYQPNDRKRVVGSVRPTRAECGLPEGGTVFCCFNGTQKITRTTFEAWMRILEAVPGSALWLLSGTSETNERLRGLAEAAAIGRERLVFAPRMPNAEHLARYPLADLFLDTFPYGAHTTASDALWMGVPVLTHPGESFASRVCGSLVRSAGLPDLVCESREAYAASAMELGRSPRKLSELKARLASSRESCVLFDTPGLVRRLEGLYRGMWRDLVDGRLPRPDLSNLGTLHEIGTEIDHEDQGHRSLGDIRAQYRAGMLQRHADIALAADPRLKDHVSDVCTPSVARLLPTRSPVPPPGRDRFEPPGTGSCPASGELLLQ